MAFIAPPHRPLQLTYSDEGGVERLRRRFWQLALAALTILVTAWFVTLGPFSAIIALVCAKHILVAILVMGIGVDADLERESWQKSTD